MKGVLTLFLSLFLGSCVYHTGVLSHNTSHFEGKTEFIDVAVGYNKMVYFAGMGGLRQDAFLNEAKRSLIANYPLKTGQSFENLSLDLKTTVFGAFQRVEVIVIADVVQQETANEITYSENYLKMLARKNPKTNDIFKLQEQIAVMYDFVKPEYYKIIGFQKNKAILFSYSKNGTINISKKKCKKLYKLEKSEELTKLFGFSPNDSVTRLREPSFPSNTPLDGKVIAMKKKLSLVVFEKDTVICNNVNLYKMKP